LDVDRDGRPVAGVPVADDRRLQTLTATRSWERFNLAMSSVIVSWKGRCTSPADQDALLGYFERLARSHRRYCADGPGPRPEISRLLAEQRGEGQARIPLRIAFDEDISGRIAVSSDIVEDQAAFAADLAGLGVETSRRAEGFGDRFTFPIDHLHIRGLDFQIYDPRGLYPREDRMSCVFLRSDDLPLLDGLICKVSGPELCAEITAEELKGTEWYVECPFLHLRYYLEDWLDLVLSWMKFFYVPDLYYFHYLPLAEYGRHSSDFEDAVAAEGKDVARESIFEDILLKFEDEADDWARQMGAL
jgi:hypothetical protein